MRFDNDIEKPLYKNHFAIRLRTYVAQGGGLVAVQGNKIHSGVKFSFLYTFIYGWFIWSNELVYLAVQIKHDKSKMVDELKKNLWVQ